MLILASFPFSYITGDGELAEEEDLLLVLLYVMMVATVFVFGA